MFQKCCSLSSENLAQKQISPRKYKKKTLVLSLEDCLLKTSMYKEEMPRVDGSFQKFNNLKIFVCFRPYLISFLQNLQKYFEIILWSSSQTEFTKEIISILDPYPHEYFSYILDITHCQKSKDESLHIKNLDILLKNRSLKDIIIVDSSMQNYTLHLTSGIYIPTYTFNKDQTDNTLSLLEEYLISFLDESDVRTKIKSDFDINEMFNQGKQAKHFNKIQNNYTNYVREQELLYRSCDEDKNQSLEQIQSFELLDHLKVDEEQKEDSM